MLLYEYKLQATTAQRAAIDEAIRVSQFLRNTCLRLWMDGRTGGGRQGPADRLQPSGPRV